MPEPVGYESIYSSMAKIVTLLNDLLKEQKETNRLLAEIARRVH